MTNPTKQNERKEEDYLGNLSLAFILLEKISPSKVQCVIDNSDINNNRYGVKLWNCFGKWYASEKTLAGSIIKAITMAQKDNFNFKK